jgi:hypothetical protein
MTRKSMKFAASAPRPEAIRSKKMGELHAYDEQQCPECGQWKSRFNYGSAPYSFDRCAECRGVVYGFTGVEDMWGELPGTASAEWLERVSEIGRKAEVKAARQAV